MTLIYTERLKLSFNYHLPRTQFRAALINDTMDRPCNPFDGDNDEHERNCCAKIIREFVPYDSGHTFFHLVIAKKKHTLQYNFPSPDLVDFGNLKKIFKFSTTVKEFTKRTKKKNFLVNPTSVE